MKMQRKKVRIGQLAEQLGVERFVIRFWEKEFNIYPDRSDGKQRFYDTKVVDKFHLIKKLLYEEGFTIAGAKKQLEHDLIITGAKKTVLNASHKTDTNIMLIQQKIINLQKQLIKLRQYL